MLINKFRGDVNLLQPGIDMFAEHVPVPVLGVIPWLELDLEDEDSQNLESKRIPDPEITVAVVRLPYLCLLYTSPSPRDVEESRMPSSA